MSGQRFERRRQTPPTNRLCVDLLARIDDSNAPLQGSANAAQFILAADPQLYSLVIDRIVIVVGSTLAIGCRRLAPQLWHRLDANPLPEMRCTLNPNDRTQRTAHASHINPHGDS